MADRMSFTWPILPLPAALQNDILARESAAWQAVVESRAEKGSPA
jgi:hypothetical protein